MVEQFNSPKYKRLSSIENTDLLLHLHGFITRLSTVLHSNLHHRQLDHTGRHYGKIIINNPIVFIIWKHWSIHKDVNKLCVKHMGTYRAAFPQNQGLFQLYHQVQRDRLTPALLQGIYWLHYNTYKKNTHKHKQK